MALTRDKLSSAVASSSCATPSRPEKHAGIFGRKTRDGGSPPKGPNEPQAAELSSAPLVVLSDSDELLAAAFGDLALDACAPRAVIEEIDELEL